jgi:hypothetical protein
MSAAVVPVVLAVLAVLWVPSPASAAPAAAGQDPAGYVRKGTWVDTMIATRDAMAALPTVAAARRPMPDFGRGDWTVAAWVRTTKGGTILAKCPAAGIWVQQGKALFVKGGRVTFDIGWVGAITAGPDVGDGKWHHVAVAGKAGRQWIYIDGRLAVAGELAGQADRDDWVVKIGRCSDNFGGDFQGELDEVRLYARTLAAEEVKALSAAVAAAEGTNDVGLAGYWPFEGSGADASGSGNSASKMIRCEYVPGRVGKALSLADGGEMIVPAGKTLDPLAAVWDRLGQDFADPASRREQAWEREDGVWDGPWRVGDWAAMARRYAEASHRLATTAAELKAQAAGVKDLAPLSAVREGYLATRRHGEAVQALAEHNLPGLREMIRSLQQTEGRLYPRGQQHLARLDELEKRGIEAVRNDATRGAWLADLAGLRRSALITDNPLIDFDKLVFIKRKTFQSNHYYTDYINGSRYFGGALCLLDLQTGKVTELAPSLKDGIFGLYDVSFDGGRIVFDWKKGPDEGFRIYEVGADGTGLRQITFPPPNEQELIRSYRVGYHHGTDDMHPCYLADGGICFISTRCQFGILCDAPDDFTTTVLYRMDGDGQHMEKLTNSSVSEAAPCAMSDGRILYTRWEYVDKGAVSVKCLWAIRPDGTCSSEVYGNDISLPPTMIHGREIPGHPNQYVVLGTPHCPQNRVGTVIRLDMQRDIRTREPMTYITPQVDIQAEGGFAHRFTSDGPWQHNNGGPLFAEPYPLSDKWFLVSHNPDKEYNDPTAYRLCLLTEQGRTVEIYRDPNISCWQPQPLRARPRPPVLASPRDEKLAAERLATAVVTDVYVGLEDVPRGTIKYLRVLEQVPRPWAARRRWGGDEYDQQHSVITKDTHLGLKVQHGVVPVEEDGSAHFVVPADRNIILQALDADYMAVQTERTYINYRPGETRTCIGCHETPTEATPASFGRPVAALGRAPSVPGPQPGEASGRRPLYYAADVQPVLDKYCVKCHSGKDPKAGLDLSGTMTALFSVSYESLLPERRDGKGRRKFDLVGPTIGENHPKTGNVQYLPARSLGSHASVLVAMLSHGKVHLQDAKAAEIAERLAKVHKDIAIPQPEMIRLTNWVDTNGQYYGSYYGRRNLRYKDHPDFRPVPTWESAIGIPPLAEKDR